MAIVRDDIAGRLHRTSVRFKKPEEEEEEEIMQDASAAPSNEETQDAMDVDQERPPPPNEPPRDELDPEIKAARTLTRTILSQSHLSPFPLGTRPLHWDYAHTLSLYPLPTALVVADSSAPSFVVKYCGCTVMNPGPIDESGGRGRREGRAKWVEYDISKGVGVVRSEG
jgi:DNA polymerase epsilon subunit 2